MTARRLLHPDAATRWGTMPTPSPDGGPEHGLRRYFLAFAMLARRSGMEVAR